MRATLSNAMLRHAYRIYGLTLESEIPFPELTPVSTKGGNLKNRVLLRVRNFSPLSNGPRKYIFQTLRHRYRMSYDYRTIDVSSPWAGVFRIHIKEKIIDWKPIGKSSLELGRVILKGRVLGLLLSYFPSFLNLHANVIVWKGKAIAFSGPIGAGKSTLTACFLNEGWSLLSDDLAVIQKRYDSFLVHPAAPEIRLWPRTISQVSGHHLHGPGNKGEMLYPETKKRRWILNPQHPWRFTKKPISLQALYFLSRQKSGTIRVETLKGKEGWTEILRNIYVPVIRPPEALKHQFELAARLAEQVSLKRIIYPSGFRHLPQVKEVILND